jgi:hypothetical protein
LLSEEDMDKKIVYSVLLSIVIVAILIYLFVIRKPTASTSASPTPSPQALISPTPSPQPFIVQTYMLSQAGNIMIPLLSENFVVSVKPLGTTASGTTSATTSPPSVSISTWFNIENDTKLHNDSLIINETPVTITQETPIIFSDVLKQNGVPYQGYPYLIIAADGPLLIKVAFYMD